MAILLLTSAASCREDQKAPEKPSTKPTTDQVTAQLVFPESLRVADETVNIFVRTALGQCAEGNYDAFRALWSERQDPISRTEFEEGWHAVHRIEVRGLQKALLAAGQNTASSEPVYVFLVEVALNPEAKAGKRAPLREIVLMLVQEHDQWRLANAPKSMREWIKQKNAASGNHSADSPSTMNP